MKRKKTAFPALLLCAILSLLPPCASAAADVTYVGIVTLRYPNSITKVYTDMSTESRVVDTLNPGNRLNITKVYPGWVEILHQGKTAYVLRSRIDEVTAVDPVNTAPYGVEFNAYYTVIARNTNVYSEKSRASEVLSQLTEGAVISLIGAEDGWARLIYKRQYGYVSTLDLEELLPINPDPEAPFDTDLPIAGYTSFYSDNPPRINNLEKCCERMNRVMVPGETLNFNGSVGPFTRGNGFMEAPVLIDGETKMGYGGGSCQVSSTLYNTVLQLQGVTILERHAHGASGAAYLPHGMDASSGALNFRIENDFGFPIRIEGSCHDLALTILIYRADGIAAASK